MDQQLVILKFENSLATVAKHIILQWRQNLKRFAFVGDNNLATVVFDFVFVEQDMTPAVFLVTESKRSNINFSGSKY